MDLRSPIRIASATRALLFRKRHPPVGAMPGTLVPALDAPPPVIHLIRYDADVVEERVLVDPEELRSVPRENGVSWIDVHGLGDEAVLRKIGEILDLHPLALEDAVNVPQRPKSEPYEQQHLFIARMMRVGTKMDLDAEQISVFIGPGYVLTFQERSGDVLDPVRKRIRAGRGPIRRSGSDYLAYALIDTVIDAYYPLLETLGERLYRLEESILTNPTPRGLRRIHAMRRDLLLIRRAVWPQREAVNSLLRDESPLISDPVRRYLRDSLDHASQITDVLESFRDITASLMDLYLSSTGQRTNEVMKVLTVMASIFIPLTFLAGVYGTNFHNLPELDWPWAYYAFWAVMITVGVSMALYFRRRGWIGGSPEPDDDDDFSV
ncbi:MAG: magnesium/cobalt transporter CorA [Gemmatimonadaceae bacterium]